MKFSSTLAALLLASAASAGVAAEADWRYAIGVHDFAVPDVDSHTYGLNGRLSVDKRTDSGRNFSARSTSFGTMTRTTWIQTTFRSGGN